MSQDNDFCETDDATAFLKQLRPQGPWTLTAIIPDGPTATCTFKVLDKAAVFIRKYNGNRNLYYSLNPTKPGLNTKVGKEDITAIEYLHADLDPHADETPAEAKERYLAALETFEPHPTSIVDSGNGLQAGWKLTEPLDPTHAAEAEAMSLAITLQLGGTAGTQNIDRILRLPGTINIPNKVKLSAGRVNCQATLIKFNGACASLDDFDLDTQPQDKEKVDDEDKLEKTIRDGGGKERGQRSETVFWVVCEMIRRGYLPKTIEATILDTGNGISAHVLEQSNPRKYAKRQVLQAIQKIDFVTDKLGKPYHVPDNIRIALAKMDIKVRYDQFADRILLTGLKDFGPVLDDPAIDRLWLVIDKRYHFQPSQNLLRTVLKDQARLNGFHPVLDYLNSLRWDGVERIDKWLITYGEAEDNEYTRAVGALSLIAAVRRVRDPGCKFDEMLIIENEIQGTGKSTALSILAVKPDWFADTMALNASAQRTIETIRGKWIIEIGELRGYRTEIEQIKATLSRQRDRSRLAYGRLVEEVARQCVFFGTTNQTNYLRDESGNRRMWPVKIKKEFDLDALLRDRDQLWAEAAAREAAGASIRLDKSLWAAAAAEQGERLTNDPFFDTLLSALMRGRETEEAKPLFKERYPRGTAYHEAGHAVVAWSLGLPVIAVSVSDDDASGNTQIGLAGRLSLVEQIAVCAAGVAATEVFGQPTEEPLAGHDDERMIVELLEAHGISQEERGPTREAGHACARTRVEAHKGKVVALAEHLVEHGRVEADEALRLIA